MKSLFGLGIVLCASFAPMANADGLLYRYVYNGEDVTSRYSLAPIKQGDVIRAVDGIQCYEALSVDTYVYKVDQYRPMIEGKLAGRVDVWPVSCD